MRRNQTVSSTFDCDLGSAERVWYPTSRPPSYSVPAHGVECINASIRDGHNGNPGWKRHHFAWEYKGRRGDLDTAFDQLRQYALALEKPDIDTVLAASDLD